MRFPKRRDNFTINQYKKFSIGSHKKKQPATADKRQRRNDVSEFQFLIGRVHPAKFTTRQLKEAEQRYQSSDTAQGKDE